MKKRNCTDNKMETKKYHTAWTITKSNYQSR